MGRIEFIGTNGVGKTTLYNNVCSSRTAREAWLKPDEALKKIVVDHFQGGAPINRRSLIKYNILKKYHERWIKEILSAYKTKIYHTTLQDYDGWINLGIEALNTIKHTHTFYKIKNFSVYCERVEHMALLDHFKLQNMVVWDEGLFRNNPGIEELPALPALLNGNSKTNPSGIVYCHLSLDENVKRLQKRTIENLRSSVVKGLMTQEKMDELVRTRYDDESIFSDCKIAYNRYKHVAETSRQAGIPVLEVNMDLDHTHNTNKVLDFIRRIEESVTKP